MHTELLYGFLITLTGLIGLVPTAHLNEKGVPVVDEVRLLFVNATHPHDGLPAHQPYLLIEESALAGANDAEKFQHVTYVTWKQRGAEQNPQDECVTPKSGHLSWDGKHVALVPLDGLDLRFTAEEEEPTFLDAVWSLRTVASMREIGAQADSGEVNDVCLTTPVNYSCNKAVVASGTISFGSISTDITECRNIYRPFWRAGLVTTPSHKLIPIGTLADEVYVSFRAKSLKVSAVSFKDGKEAWHIRFEKGQRIGLVNLPTKNLGGKTSYELVNDHFAMFYDLQARPQQPRPIQRQFDGGGPTKANPRCPLGVFDTILAPAPIASIDAGAVAASASINEDREQDQSHHPAATRTRPADGLALAPR